MQRHWLRSCSSKLACAASTRTAVHTAKVDAGSIGDLFTSLGTAPPVLDARFASLKERLRPPADTLKRAWQRLQLAVEREVDEIQASGSAVIPTLQYSDIASHGGYFPPEKAAEVRRRGCVVVRNTLDAELALEMKRETREYISRNRAHLSGFPKDNPQVWEVYWSKPQGEMRQHPHMLTAQRALNRLWHCRASQGQVSVDVHRPLTYGERLRIREPGDESFTLGPHVDGGSVERWEDDEYRSCYADILSCEWERYDPWDATHRAAARCDMYNLNIGLCTTFRSFQGWLALSSSGAGRGALQLVPMLREATAFLLLRPFMEDVPAASFCGANPGKTQDLFPEFHGPVIRGLVPVPDIGPGDTLWWHCDLIHAVEGAHGGSEDSSVYYIPAMPLCSKNAAYVRKQAVHFEGGMTPPDFPPNHAEVDCADRCVPSDLSDGGLQAMGLGGVPDARLEGESEDDFEASQALRSECHSILTS